MKDDDKPRDGELRGPADHGHEDRDRDHEHGKGNDRDHDQKVTIIVNGRPKVVKDKDKMLSFREIVALAFDNPPTGDNIVFTITYRKGPRANPEGTLVEGGSVKIQDGMIFNVTATDKS